MLQLCTWSYINVGYRVPPQYIIPHPFSLHAPQVLYFKAFLPACKGIFLKMWDAPYYMYTCSWHVP